MDLPMTTKAECHLDLVRYIGRHMDNASDFKIVLTSGQAGTSIDPFVLVVVKPDPDVSSLHAAKGALDEPIVNAQKAIDGGQMSIDDVSTSSKSHGLLSSSSQVTQYDIRSMYNIAEVRY